LEINALVNGENSEAVDILVT